MSIYMEIRNINVKDTGKSETSMATHIQLEEYETKERVEKYRIGNNSSHVTTKESQYKRLRYGTGQDRTGRDG